MIDWQLFNIIFDTKLSANHEDREEVTGFSTIDMYLNNTNRDLQLNLDQ